MILIDKNYDGETFMLSECVFAQDLLHIDVSDNEEGDDILDEEIIEKLKIQKRIEYAMKAKDCGDQIMVIYIDIFGNEFREALKITNG